MVMSIAWSGLLSIFLASCAGPLQTVVTVTEYDREGHLLGSTHYRAAVWFAPAPLPAMQPKNNQVVYRQ